LISIGRPAVVAPLGCCAEPVFPLAPITVAAVAAVAATLQRNWRRDGTELHALQKQDTLPPRSCVMESSRE